MTLQNNVRIRPGQAELFNKIYTDQGNPDYQLVLNLANQKVRIADNTIDISNSFQKIDTLSDAINGLNDGLIINSNLSDNTKKIQTITSFSANGDNKASTFGILDPIEATTAGSSTDVCSNLLGVASMSATNIANTTQDSPTRLMFIDSLARTEFVLNGEENP